MPYIKHTDRPQFEDAARELGCKIENAGDLNFVVSMIINIYLKRKGLKYKVLNEMIGALECAKLELYRRIAAPYEDTKIEENGDVYS